MKIKILLILCAVSLGAYSQLLWQITGNKIKAPSYLLGTHALIPAKALDSVPDVYKAFNKCNVVISRYNVYSDEAALMLKKAAFLPLSKPIHSYLSDSAYASIDNELQRVIKLNLKQTAYMHPAVIRQMYLSELFNMAVKISDEAQTDSYFQRVASVKGIAVVGLENYTSYLNTVYDPAKIQEHASKLQSDILHAQNYTADFVRLMQLYENGNLQALTSFLKPFSDKIDVVKSQNSYSDENIERLSELMKNNSCFISTDILQLDENNGLIALLRKAGYDVKPYPAKRIK